MAIFLSFIYGAAVFYFSIFFPYTGLILSILLLLLIIFLSRHNDGSLKIPNIALILILCASGFFYAKLLYTPQSDPLELQGSSVQLKGFLKSQRHSSAKDSPFLLQSINVIEAFDAKGDRLYIKEVQAINESPLENGKIYYFKGRFSKDGYYLNPRVKTNLPTLYVLSATETGEHINNFFEEFRTKLNYFMRESFSDKSSAFLMSIITGERVFLSPDTKQAFAVTGLAHILSISGAHFGLLFVILFACFRTLLVYLPYKLLTKLTLYFMPSQIAAAMTIPFLIFYLGISSLSIPSLRAFIMITLFLVGLLVSRKGVWLNTLAIAAFIIILISPDAITDLSFQLSFMAMLCIGLITDILRRKDVGEDIPQQQLKKGFLLNIISSIFGYLKYSFLISLGVTVGTAPLVAYYFHYFSIISPITNLLLTPLIGFIILPLALFSSLSYLAVGIFPLVSLLDNFTLFVLDLIEMIARWSFIDIKIPGFPLFLLFTFYAGFLFFVAIERRRAVKSPPIPLHTASLTIALLPFIIYATVKFYEPGTLKITFLDVGQGDAAVVELPDNCILVIDTGKSGYQVAEYLKYRGVRHIDALAISHWHIDHSGGVEYLLNNFNILEVWSGGIEPFISFSEQQFRFRKLQRGDVLQGNGYKINIFHPYDEFYTQSTKNDANNFSLVMKITGLHNSFLFAGDIEREAQEDLVNLKTHLKSNVLKTPHHGSKSSADEAFYQLVSPEIAIISVGRKNLTGHPHKDSLQILRTTTVLRTDIDGAASIQEMPNGGLKIKTFRDFQIRKVINPADEVLNIKRLLSVW